MKVCNDHGRFFCKECFLNHRNENQFMRFDIERAADRLCDSLLVRTADRDEFVTALDDYFAEVAREKERMSGGSDED